MNLGFDRSSYWKSIFLSNLFACLSCCAGNFAKTAETALALTAHYKQSKGCLVVVYHLLRKSARTLPFSNIHYLLIGHNQKRNMRRVIIKKVIVCAGIFCWLWQKRVAYIQVCVISPWHKLWLQSWTTSLERKIHSETALAWEMKKESGGRIKDWLKRERHRKSEMYVLPVKDGGAELKWRGRDKFLKVNKSTIPLS